MIGLEPDGNSFLTISQAVLFPIRWPEGWVWAP
jgi:hypothetical protein